MTDPRADETPSDKIKGESELKYPLPWIIVSPKFLALNSSEYLLRKAREKAHILEGLAVALSNIDEIIKLIKESKNSQEAKTKLLSNL